jgi:CDP-diacylglycerol--inositol 3-phosphatidyltransferase
LRLHRSDCWKCCFYYLLSGFMDALDGHAARKWGQSSQFGACLDMITDRCATSLLMVGLAVMYPAYAFHFQMLIGLDICSHWVQMTATYVTGAGSHKTIDLSKNIFLYYYYTSRPVLFVVCAANEWLWSMLYVVFFMHSKAITDPYAALSTPPPDDCSWALPLTIAGTTLSVWQWIAWGCLPVSTFKNVVNVIQLLSASSDLGGADMADRAKARRSSSSGSGSRSPSPARKKKGRDK